MKKVILFLAIISVFACNENTSKGSGNESVNIAKEKERIGAMLDSLNMEAAKADYNGYFKFYADSAIFIGTDAKEYWRKDAFMKWAKPYFDRGKAWSFKAIRRNIYFGTSSNIAWFDELLSTQMKICRGSGVVVKQNNEWKVQQYVLSMTIPNEKSKDVIDIKASTEDSLINTLQK